MSWTEKLQNRWQLKSGKQVFLVLLTFACTGTSVLLLKKPIFAFLGLETLNAWQKALYWVLIIPVYQLLLLAYGFLFGQFRFFWEFEKRTFRRIFGVKQKSAD